MQIYLDSENHPVFCRDCGSVHISLQENVCFICGSNDIQSSSLGQK